jgi:hypothetical protein
MRCLPETQLNILNSSRLSLQFREDHREHQCLKPQAKIGKGDQELEKRLDQKELT